MTRLAAYAIVTLTVCGCAKSADKATDWRNEAAAAGMRSVKMVPVTTQPADAPRDAQSAVPLKVYMDVYQLSVPLGSVSRNEDFWKRLDENVIDVGTRDLLLKNG